VHVLWDIVLGHDFNSPCLVITAFVEELSFFFSPKLNDELKENPEEFKTVPTKRSYASGAHRSSTLPRSYGVSLVR